MHVDAKNKLELPCFLGHKRLRSEDPFEGCVQDEKWEELKELCLDLESNAEKIGQKILCTKNEILQKNREGNFRHIFKKYAKYRECLEESLIDYQLVVSHYVSNSETSLLSSKKDRGAIEMAESLLMKIIRRANLCLAEGSVVPIQGSDANILDLKKFALCFDNQQPLIFFVGRKKNRELFLLNTPPLDLAKSTFFLGKGRLGCVLKVLDISAGDLVALKITLLILGRLHLENDLIREFYFLKQLHSPLLMEGVQSGGREIIRLEKGVAIGYITKIYNRSSLNKNAIMFSSPFFSFSNRIKIICNLFTGLKNLHERGLVHGDIKPENCLVHSAPDTTPSEVEVVIADLEGIRSKEELASSKKFGTYTRGFFTREDYKLFLALEEQVEDPDRRFFYHQQRDVFALATTLWMVLTLNAPYLFLIDNNQTLLTKIPLTQDLHNYSLVVERIGVKCADILKNALSESPVDRKTAKEIVGLLTEQMHLLDERPLSQRRKNSLEEEESFYEHLSTLDAKDL